MYCERNKTLLEFNQGMWDLKIFWFIAVCICLELKSCIALEREECREPLGMQSGEIPDSAITASSVYDDPVGPQYARIRTEMGGGAWCPRGLISNNSYEYLQIDLGRPTKVTMVEIQGRFGNGQGREYAETFRLEFQYGTDGEWTRYIPSSNNELFPGNVDTYIAEKRELSPPIICTKIRFIPYSDVPSVVCMRVEMYGCSVKPLPSPPSNVQVVAVSATQVTLTWQPPSVGPEIIGYEIFIISLSLGPEFYAEEVRPDANSYTAKYLQPDTKYEITIYSMSVIGRSSGVAVQVQTTSAEENCAGALGMESGDIPDNAITASSYFSYKVRPEYGRIRTEISGGAWCPEPFQTRDYEFLQIDLGQLTQVTIVEIQGRFGNGRGNEFVRKFRLEYQLEDGGEWHRYVQEDGKEIMSGNFNTFTSKSHKLTPPIIGIKIRFVPDTLKTAVVCMRVELYGCKAEVGLSKSPENLKAEEVSDTEIYVTWSPPDYGDVITGYILSVQKSEEIPIIKFELSSDTVSYNLTGLEPRTAYAIKLACKNSRGRGPESVIQVKTPFKDPCLLETCPENSTCVNVQIFKAVGWFVPRCVCESGFVWNDNDQTCVDKDECAIRDICSQSCINTVGSYLCECKSGFTLGSYGSCSANGDTSWFYVASSTGVLIHHRESGYEEILVDGASDIKALDYDLGDALIFYSDVGNIKGAYIPQYTEDGVIDTNQSLYTIKPVDIDTGIDSGVPVDIAVDWISNRVYWIDGLSKKIKSASYSGDMIKTVIDDGLDEPRHIALHPENGYLYWTDNGPTPYIGRIGLDGSHRGKILTYQDGLKNLVGLSIDYTNSRLYWIAKERHLIGSSNLDGSDYVIVVMDPNIIQHPISLTVFEDRLSWIEQETQLIHSINRRTGHDVETLHVTTDSALTDLSVYQAQMQDTDFQAVYSSMCLEATCEQICVTRPGEKDGVSCDCADGFYLHQDGGSCVQQD